MNQTYAACPKCGQPRTRVVCTKRDEAGVLIRRRCCFICEHRWYTMQYPEVAITNSEVKWIGRNGCKAEFVPST